MTDNIMGLVGLGVGLGIGLFTLKTLEKLSPKHRTEIEKILSLSKRTGTSFEVEVRNVNLIKAKNVLKRSGFKIINQYGQSPTTTLIIYEERMKR